MGIYTSSRVTLGDRGFFGFEPIIGAMIDVFTPGIRSKPEILCQQLSKFSRSFAREHPLYQVLMVRISFWLPQEDPSAWLGAEDILAPVSGENVCGILAWATAAQRKLTQVAKCRHGSAMHGELICSTGTSRSPPFNHLFPNGIHIVPIFRIFLAQPFALGGTRYHKVKPQSRPIGVGAGINHVMIDIEFILKNVPIPRFLEAKFVKHAQVLIDNPLFHKFLE